MSDDNVHGLLVDLLVDDDDDETVRAPFTPEPSAGPVVSTPASPAPAVVPPRYTPDPMPRVSSAVPSAPADHDKEGRDQRRPRYFSRNEYWGEDRIKAAYREFEGLYRRVARASDFFDAIEDSGLPVVCIAGSTQVGKSTLLGTLKLSMKTDGDRLGPVATYFGVEHQAGDIVKKLAGLKPIDGHRLPPIVCDAYESGQKVHDLWDDDFDGWLEHNGALIRAAYDFYEKYRFGFGADEIYAHISSTTQHLVAHWLEIHGEEFILLDLPGEVMAPGRPVSTIVARRFPAVASALILVEPFDTLFASSELCAALEFESVLGARTPLGEYLIALGVASWEGSNADDIQQWKTTIESMQRHGIRPPCPVLVAISKFEPLAGKPLLLHPGAEASGNAGICDRVAAWNRATQGLVDAVDGLRTESNPLHRLDTETRGLLTASRELLGSSPTVWDDLLDERLRQKYWRHEAITFLPCRSYDPKTATPTPHGTRLLKQWVFSCVRAARRWVG